MTMTFNKGYGDPETWPPYAGHPLDPRSHDAITVEAEVIDSWRAEINRIESVVERGDIGRAVAMALALSRDIASDARWLEKGWLE